MERYFLLKSYEVSTAPGTEIRKIGWVPNTDPPVRVFLENGQGAICAERDGRVLAEQATGAALAEALLSACGSNVITVAESESEKGDWRILQYEGRHWGLVIGITDIRKDAVELPAAPFGWKVVKEVTGEKCANERDLAMMSDAEVSQCLGRA